MPATRAVTTRGAQIEDEAHLAELVARKRAARHHRGQDRLAQVAPNSRELLMAAAERGENLGSLTAALLRLLDTYGASELQAAIAEALARGVPHPNAVRLSLERRREQRATRPHPAWLELWIVIHTTLEQVVWDAAVQMMDMVQTDVGSQPLQDFWQAVVGTSMQGSLRILPLVSVLPKCFFELMLDVEHPNANGARYQHDGQLDLQ